MELPPITNDNIKDLVKNRANYSLSIGKWDVSNVTDMSELFSDIEDFNEDISEWNVSNVTSMEEMFKDAKSFNQPLDKWDVSNVECMTGMFEYALSFNQPLNNWNTNEVAHIGYMFCGAKSFNQSLNNWNVSNIFSFKSMFSGATSFNQPLDKWNVSKADNMSMMFMDAKSFNQPLNSWNVSRVINMYHMFDAAESFNQPLTNWRISPRAKIDNMFKDCPIESINKPTISFQDAPRVPKPSVPNPDITYNEPITFNRNEKCFDIIMGDEVPINEYIKDGTNMVFVFYDNDIKNSQKVGIEIREFSKAMNNKKNYTIYGCKQADTMRPENIDKNTPYFDIKKLCGFGDLVRLRSISMVLNDLIANKIAIFKKSDNKLLTTVSDDVLNHRTDYVSARHCQEGQSADVYLLVPNVNFVDEAIGGRRKQIKQIKQIKQRTKKRRYTKKRRITKKKRSNTKKINMHI